MVDGPFHCFELKLHYEMNITQTSGMVHCIKPMRTRIILLIKTAIYNRV